MSSKITPRESVDQDVFGRDTELWSAFLHAIVDDPAILEEIPGGAAVVLFPDDDPELAETNLKHGIDAARNGADVYIRHVPGSKSTP